MTVGPTSPHFLRPHTLCALTAELVGHHGKKHVVVLPRSERRRFGQPVQPLCSGYGLRGYGFGPTCDPACGATLRVVLTYWRVVRLCVQASDQRSRLNAFLGRLKTRGVPLSEDGAPARSSRAETRPPAALFSSSRQAPPRDARSVAVAPPNHAGTRLTRDRNDSAERQPGDGGGKSGRPRADSVGSEPSAGAGVGAAGQRGAGEPERRSVGGAGSTGDTATPSTPARQRLMFSAQSGPRSGSRHEQLSELSQGVSKARLAAALKEIRVCYSVLLRVLRWPGSTAYPFSSAVCCRCSRTPTRR